MANIVTREEILKDYLGLGNFDEYINSDILILPTAGNNFNRIFYNSLRDLPDIEINICSATEKFLIVDHLPEILYIGSFVFNTVGFIGSFITIYEHLKKYYRSHKIECDNYIEIENTNTDNTKTVNKYYLFHPYIGKASDINIEKELEEIKKELMILKKRKKKIHQRKHQ